MVEKKCFITMTMKPNGDRLEMLIPYLELITVQKIIND